MQSKTQYFLEKHPFYGVLLRIKIDGKNCSPFSSELDNTLRNLLRSSLAHEDISVRLENWLLNLEEELPEFHVKINHEYHLFCWDPNLFYAQKLSISSHDSSVYFSEKGINNELLFLSNTLFLDLSLNKIGRLTTLQSSGSIDFEKLFSTRKKQKIVNENFSFYLNQNKGISYEMFNQLDIQFNTLDDINQYYFLAEGKEQQISKHDLMSSLLIYYKLDDPWVRLQLSFHADTWQVPASAVRQDQAVNIVDQASLSLREKKALAKFIIRCLSSDNKSRLLTHFLPKICPDIKLAQNIQAHISDLNQQALQLYFEKGSFVLASVNTAKESLFWYYVSLLFSPAWQHSSLDNVYMVPQQPFFEHFEALKEITKHLDYQLNFSEKSFDLVDYDIQLDLSNLSDSADFPSILLNNQLIDFKDFEQLSSNIWQDIQADSDTIVHPDTLKKIQRILQLVNFQKKEKKENSVSLQLRSHFHILDWIELRKSGITVTLSDAQESMIDSFKNFKELKKIELPKKLQATAREYQADSLHWFAFLYKHKLGAILADDMGLGKTFQAIQFLAAIHEGFIKKQSVSPHLIVMPPSLLYNWENELKRFYPDFKVSLYVGAERAINEKSDIILSTYEIIRRDIEQLKNVSFDCIIFDESQFVKNAASARSKACRDLKAEFRLCLTGTPLENHVGEYISMLDLILPGFSHGIQINDLFESNMTDILLKRSKIFVLRRLKRDILEELPKKTEENVFLTMLDSQKQYYSGLIQSVKKEVSEIKKEKGSTNTIMILTLLMRLRQVCLSPQLIDNTYSEITPKYDYLINQLKTLNTQGYSALVFTQFKISLNIIEKLCKQEELNVFRIDGSTTALKRKKLIDEFQESKKASVFIMSLKAGGFGLNLTKANYVFHVDPWWNPAVENQATDRTHRIGQEQPVFSYKLIMHDSIEQKMITIKEHKSKLFNELFTNSDIVKRKETLSADDITYLLDD